MFSLAEFDLVDDTYADHLLEKWGHFLGALNRPFGRQSFVLSIEGEAASVAVSASTVGISAGGIPRFECVELARLCTAPGHKDLTRVALRLWRRLAPMCWKRSYWPVRAVVSYQDQTRHKGDIYRFDGWKKVSDVKGSTGGGHHSTKKDRVPKAVWVYELGRVA